MDAMDLKRYRIAIGVLVLFALNQVPISWRVGEAGAATVTWLTPGPNTNDWFTPTNWSGGVAPTNGDDVVITNIGASVSLTNSTFPLGSLTISNATLSFSNWDTTLYATNVTILRGGTQTCCGPFTNTAMSNRVSINCTTLFIATGASINVKGKGFSGGINTTNTSWRTGHGPGGGTIVQMGGGYGGAGSQYGGVNGLITTLVYGSATAPLDPGSGGASYLYTNTTAGSGGGAVFIIATQVVVNGSINADFGPPVVTGPGGSTTYAAGGSGGGIYIICSTITGTNGTITALGGGGISILTGGGGGGRIAVLYDPAAQSSVPVPSISFSVKQGSAGDTQTSNYGDIGTLYFPDNYFLSPTNLFTGQWLAPGFTNWSVADLLVSNVWIRMPGAGFRLTVTNTLSVIGINYAQYRLELTNAAAVNCGQLRLNGSSLTLNGATGLFPSDFAPHNTGLTLSCSGDLVLTNSSRLYISSGLTNADAPGYGSLVTISNDVRIYTNCWIYPAAHATNGTPTLVRMRNLTIYGGGGFNADSLGYGYGGVPGTSNPGYGPGTALYSGGAGYGGAGTNGYFNPGGPTYGLSNAPLDPGSSARAGSDSTSSGMGGAGGGSVQIRATETVTIQGTITANGRPGGGTWYGGGGAGGGIYITCRTFVGATNGILRANGGQGNNTIGKGGSGGGGRIAVWRMYDQSTGTISNYVDGGAAAYGGFIGSPGTIVWGWIPVPGTITTFR
ncbi:MAG: G8 domain-containing protein [Lentisphaerae bacterium]|nr:G8 domain-containing protein [Lentisphaerota bacterium]